MNKVNEQDPKRGREKGKGYPLGGSHKVHGSHLPGINIAVGKCHWRIILVHNFATQATDNSRINVMAEWDFFS